MKKIYVFIFLIIFIICTIFFIKNAYKLSIFGNTINKSDDSKILNISSYEAVIEAEIHSNKNINKYVLIQKYANPNIFMQEVIEPENIKGLTTIFDGTNLILENRNLNLKNIYENYTGIEKSSLSLMDFIEEYRNKENAKLEETETEEIITITNDNNKYETYKKLYINKSSNLPTKMEILDINQNITVYILYREIKINKTSKEQILGN